MTTRSLGKEEAIRRLKSGLGTAQSNFGRLSEGETIFFKIDYYDNSFLATRLIPPIQA